MSRHHLVLLGVALPLMVGIPAQAGEDGIGLASFYSAVPNPSERLTGAHRTLPFGTMVSVTRVDTGAQVVVRINDRGPFIRGRVIDLSRPAAEQLGIVGMGLARVRVQIIPPPRPAVRTVSNPQSPFDCAPCAVPLIVE